MAKLYVKKSDGTYVPQKSQSVTNIDIVQETGDSVTAAMSQDAVTKEFAKKANTSTTLAGYGIGDAYTKTEVDEAIANAITTTLNTEV